MSSLDGEINDVAEKILSTIEQTNSKNLESSAEVTAILHLIDVQRAKKLLQHMDNVSTRSERNVGKMALVRALLLSTWLQRLYFVIRSFIMGLLSASLTFSFILLFGSIGFTLEIVLGIFSFVFALAVSRLFDEQLVMLTRKIITFLSDHRKLRNFIINHF